MRIAPFIYLLAFAALSACTFQQKDGDLRAEAAPILKPSVWKVTQQAATTDGEKLCTVSAGEIDVTLHSYKNEVARQVALSKDSTNYPGSKFKLLVGTRQYSMHGEWYDEAESARIIEDFLHADTVYAERMEAMAGTRQWRRFQNKILLNGFADLYQRCQKYIGASAN